MNTRRLSPIFLACAAAISFLSIPARAQSIPVSLTNSASLSAGMSATGARSFETKSSSAVSSSGGVAANSPNAGAVGTAGIGNGASVGTVGAVNNPSAVTNGSSGSSTINGTTTVANASNGQYTYNSNGQMVSTGGASGDFMGPLQPAGTIIGAGTAAASGPDWLKVVQIAAPIVAGLTGNAKIGQIAGIAGSGAQIYNAVSTGQELTAQNYANIGNIALQGAALATNNANIDKAAALGTLGVGAWNAYSALTPGSTSTASASTGTLAGYTSTGQPVYQSSTPTTSTSAAGSSFNWGAVASIAQSTAPALGNITGNAALGQLGQVAGLTGQVYNQTGGFGTQQANGQVATVYNASNQNQQVYSTTPPFVPTQQQSLTQMMSLPAGGPAQVYSPAQAASDKAMLANSNARLDNILQQQPSLTQMMSLPAGGPAQVYSPAQAASDKAMLANSNARLDNILQQQPQSPTYTAENTSTFNRRTLTPALMSAASNPTIFSANVDPRKQASDEANARTSAQISSIGTGVANGATSAIMGWLK